VKPANGDGQLGTSQAYAGVVLGLWEKSLDGNRKSFSDVEGQMVGRFCSGIWILAQWSPSESQRENSSFVLQQILQRFDLVRHYPIKGSCKQNVNANCSVEERGSPLVSGGGKHNIFNARFSPLHNV
jgi:hypothetical protein